MSVVTQEMHSAVLGAYMNRLMTEMRADSDGELDIPSRDEVEFILAALRTAGFVIEQGWQPIETAPRDGTEVLIGCSRTQSQRWAVWSGGMWRDGQDFAGGKVSGVPSPTHWRPLPTPPEGQP